MATAAEKEINYKKEILAFSSFKIIGNISTQLIQIKLPATNDKTYASFSIVDTPNPIKAPIRALKLTIPFENNAYELVNLFSSNILVSPISQANS
ncbi:unnamed protein product [Paramecium sonneborni]|uniref:Uncharacterized protein n=1 Tax=Paramecium sonneborni TaxID=65129 RepID=A0A8S1LMQ5_9CILI|nr:unnamed protein product [Paramecium sonneborni]